MAVFCYLNDHLVDTRAHKSPYDKTDQHYDIFTAAINRKRLAIDRNIRRYNDLAFTGIRIDINSGASDRKKCAIDINNSDYDNSFLLRKLTPSFVPRAHQGPYDKTDQHYDILTAPFNRKRLAMNRNTSRYNDSTFTGIRIDINSGASDRKKGAIDINSSDYDNSFLLRK